LRHRKTGLASVGVGLDYPPAPGMVQTDRPPAAATLTPLTAVTTPATVSSANPTQRRTP